MSTQKVFKTLRIDPSMFIRSPYEDCPKCKRADAFGVSTSIGRNSYTKKCKECFYVESYKLPKLNKKIIYLDQFVISDMMKSINKNVGKIGKVSNIFLQLFSELDSLVKAQLILCPDSEFHREESLLSNFKALKRMYEHLSNATTLYDPLTITRFQIAGGFKRWLKKKDPEIKKLDVDLILHGDRNEWQDRLLITVDFKIQEKEINEYRNSKIKINEKIKELFDEWKKEKKTFQEFYDKENSVYGPLLVRRYLDAMTKMLYQRINNIEISTEEYIALAMGESNTLITNLMHYLPEKQSDEEKLKAIISYLNSPEFRKLPFNVISSSLWAAIEYQASTGGRKNPPNVGMVNDIDMVSTLLPYCDAILVDNDMRSILNFREVKKIREIYKTKVFSLSNKNELFLYLKTIKNKASRNHYKIIENVYGKDWRQPFFGMYD